MPIFLLFWDDKAVEHVGRHGVRPDEVEQSVENVLHTYNRLGRTIVIGQTLGGRYLFVVLEYVDQGEWYTVTARDASVTERRMAGRKGKGK